MIGAPAITLNAYRGRWRPEPVDPRYEVLQRRLEGIETIATPTLMIQGAADMCDGPEESEGQARYFTGGYRRVVLDGIEHFPAREAPDAVARAVLEEIA